MPWTEAEKVDYLADPFRAWAWKNDEPWFPFDAEPPPAALASSYQVGTADPRGRQFTFELSRSF